MGIDGEREISDVFHHREPFAFGFVDEEIIRPASLNDPNTAPS
jgi:hypothetical protein